MFKKSSPYERALYIVLVPIVLLIILLNSGYLQRLLPAAAVHGKTYHVVDYNYFYFDYYNTFLDENEDELDALGYDPEGDDSKQSYDGSMTWKDYFKQQAEAELAETAYYCDLAEQAGYQFSEEELQPVQDKLDENEAFYSSYSLTAKNYYISYYGAGMTEEIYTKHLTEQVKAQAYKAVVTEQNKPDDAAIDAWLAETSEADYNAVNLSVITLDALPDRETGEVGAEQLDALQSKLDELAGRYADGTAFAELQAAFSTDELGDENGVITDGIRADLPEILAAWCIDGQSSLKAGDTFAAIDSETGIAYFAVLDGFGDSGPRLDAAAALGEAAANETAQSAAASDYAVKTNSIGMLLATA